MKCPHCGKDKSNVFESRKHNAEVWRRRLCQLCLKTFVTLETTSSTLKFPTELNGPGRQKARWVTPKPKSESVGGHLEVFWKTTGGMSVGPEEEESYDERE